MPITGTRVTAQDVSRYRKTDTGTAGKGQRKSSKMSGTRVTGAGVKGAKVEGKHKSSKMSGTRVTK